MIKSTNISFAFILFFYSAFAFSAIARTEHPKPFRRALVIAGGGITPGASLGLIAGARAAGFEPDVIIATCGASLGAAISNAYPNSDDAIRFVKSAAFHQTLQGLVQLDETFALNLKSKLDEAESHPSVIPPLFSGNILRIPETVHGLLPRETFSSGRTRIVILSARANFGPEDVGRPFARPSFEQVYFTDAATAGSLRGLRSTIHDQFPDSYVGPNTRVVTGLSTVEASRASISDPYFMNPAKIGSSYYFTGAMNLYPIAEAETLAEEVLVTYPYGRYDHYEDLAISTAFGFSQRDRAKLAARETHVKWIDVSGLPDLALDPTPSGLVITNQIPASLEEFDQAIDRQYSFGYWRAVEAVQLQKNIGNVRSHLRQPL